MSFNLTEEVEDVEAKQAQEEERMAKSTRKKSKLEWVYVMRGDKRPRIKLISSMTNKRVILVEELFKLIMQARYGEEGVKRAAHKKPREAVLTLEDLRAGRSTSENARKRAIECMVALTEATSEDWKIRHGNPD